MDEVTMFARNKLYLEDVTISIYSCCKISPCPRTTVCNKCAQSNTSDDTLITGDNADDEDIFGFSKSYFQTAPSHLDECKKNKY